MQIHSVRTIKRLFERWFSPEECDIVERQQRSVFVFSTLMILAGAPLDIFRLSGPTDPVFAWINVCWLLLLPMLVWLYIKRKAVPGTLVAWQLYIAQSSMCAAMLYCAFNATEYNRMVILADLCISVAILMLSLIAFLRWTAMALTAISLSTYSLCVGITGDNGLGSFLPLFYIIFILMAWLGSRLVENTKRLDKENSHIKEEDRHIFGTLNMDREKMRALADMSLTRNPDEKQVDVLLGMVDGDIRERIVHFGAEHVRQERMEVEKLARAFPELSRSEIEICRLVLLGKKQGEIMAILGKSKGNITSQRTHIRRKLGITSSDHLFLFLQGRIVRIDGE